jgi:hypothetical protein
VIRNAAQWISNQSHILTDHFDDRSKKHAMSINSKTIARSLAVEKSIDAKTNLRNRNARGWQRDSFQVLRILFLNWVLLSKAAAELIHFYVDGI